MFAKLAQAIASRAGVEMRPASQHDVAQLAQLGATGSVYEFFSQSEPSTCAEIASVRLWPIQDLLVENTRMVPGADLHPRGFVVVGTNDCGDAYCVDLATSALDPVVVLYSHEEDWSQADDAKLRAFRKVVASSFSEFVAAFVAGSLDREPSLGDDAG